jgi:N-acetylglucosamine-6-phosphate deacetylase
MNITGRLLGKDGIYRLKMYNGIIQSITEVKKPLPDLPLIIPGLIDIQVNGYGGYDFNHPAISVASVEGCLRQLWNQGITSICPTIITNSLQFTLKAVKTIADACKQNPLIEEAILGIHLEGPFISNEDGPRGTHDAIHTRNPDLEVWNRLQEAAQGRIRLLTVAPELPGGLDFIETLSKRGVVIAIGHTAAAPEVIDQAIQCGAKLVTHIGNGVHPWLHRHDSYIWEELSRDELWASMIGDGIHLPERMMRCVLKCKGKERTVLISDSLSPAGLKPGEYPGFGDCTLRVEPDGRIVRADTGILSGSSANVGECVRKVMRLPESGGFEDAVRMATVNPSIILGLASEIGSIEPGKHANFTMIKDHPGQDDNFEIIGTVIRGELVFSKSIILRD